MVRFMTISKQLFSEAIQVIPGGVNSPVRAFKGVGGDPIFIKSGHGPYLVDVDDQEYIDYIGSWGPLILGHAHPEVIAKVTAALQHGCGFGAPTEVEVRLAQKVTQLMPSIEMVRFVSSGTEAVMSAIRLARGFTKRQKIIKFAGCYHGHADSVLVAAGSGALTFGVPSSAGVPESIAQHTLVAEYNHLEEVAALFARYRDDIAAVIVEPVAGNMNCVLPEPGFLKGLRDLCDQQASVLIFDEVMTGFRVALGGAQAYYGITPDLTVLGKIVGGGLPAAAFGGKREIMQQIAPLGSVYQAGTLSGNPIAMTAGLATLELIEQPHFYTQLAQQTLRLVDGIKAAANQHDISLYVNAIGGMFGLFFTDAENIRSEGDVKRCNQSLFKDFFHAMINEGIYFAPSAFEAGFVSCMHSDVEIDRTIAAASNVFAAMKESKPDGVKLAAGL